MTKYEGWYYNREIEDILLITDITLSRAELYYIPVKTRLPLRFGNETVRTLQCLRVKLEVENRAGSRAEGWGEVPLNVQWIWPLPEPAEPADPVESAKAAQPAEPAKHSEPMESAKSAESAEQRCEVLKSFAGWFAKRLLEWDLSGHALEIGCDVLSHYLEDARRLFNTGRDGELKLPFSSALAVFAAFDIAIHDAYGVVNQVPLYSAYQGEFFNRDLSFLIHSPDIDSARFEGLYPSDFFRLRPVRNLDVWHLVGGDDPLHREDLEGLSVDDGYPLLLRDWIERDGLTSLKIKMFGKDPDEDFNRIVSVGKIAVQERVVRLSVDFNCTVKDLKYMRELMDRLKREQPHLYDMLLFVEQPFSASSVREGLDVNEISGMKPFFLDEGLMHWDTIPAAVRLGWTGAALKTCKSQSSAVLCGCAAQVYGMELMVMDLTNPMLAALSHAALASHTPTLAGVESNGPQYYPQASLPEEDIHPGIFRRRKGEIDVSSMSGYGIGYRIGEIKRDLPVPACSAETGGGTRASLYVAGGEVSG